MQTADEIGKRLSQEAVWYQDRCNWLGAVCERDGSTNFQPGMAYAALGPDLYSGTSGVALFLAELYSTTGDAMARQKALGAMRQALSRVDAVPPSSRLGLYTGWVGIAFAAVRVGTVLGEDELLERGVPLLQRSALEKRHQHEFDLLFYEHSLGSTIILYDITSNELKLEEKKLEQK